MDRIPMARFPAGTPVEEMSAALEEARRNSRFRFAKQRIRAIAEGAPQLTPEQFAELRSLLPSPDMAFASSKAGDAA
jgi:hypothetical protein